MKPWMGTNQAFVGNFSAFYNRNRPVFYEIFFTLPFSSTIIIPITICKNGNLFYNDLRHKYCFMSRQYWRFIKN